MIVRSAQFDLAALCFVFVLYRSGLSRLESITVNPESPNIPVSLADRPPAGWDLAEASKICTACTDFLTPPSNALDPGSFPFEPFGFNQRALNRAAAALARDSTDALIVCLYYPVFRVWAGYGVAWI